MLLSELVDHILSVAPAAAFSSATVKQYRCSIARLIQFLDDRELTTLHNGDIAAWCDWLHQQPQIRSTTGNSYRRAVASVLRHVGRADLSASISLRAEPRPMNKAISEEDFARLLTIANVRDTAILLLLAESGCRRGAIPRLKLSAVTIGYVKGEFRVVVRTRQKGRRGGRPITVFAGHKAGLALQLWLATRPFPGATYLFTRLSDGGPLQPSSVSDIISRLKKRAGIPRHHHVNCHAFRHRFAKVQVGRHDLKTVSELMGHSSTGMTERYITHTDNELARAYFGDDLLEMSFPE